MQDKFSYGDLKSILERLKGIESMISSIPSFIIYSEKIKTGKFYLYTNTLKDFKFALDAAIYWIERAVTERERILN